jgi:transglutaminase-like putative cysteine protease
MRLKIVHEIAATFEPPLTLAVRKIRMTPRTFDGQYVVDWRIDVDHDCRLDRVLDAYGNLLHNFSVVGPLRDLAVTAAGEVEVDDTNGVLQASARERLPPGLFLRDTRLTHPSDAIRDLAAGCLAAAGPNPLDRCHALMHALHECLEAGPAGLDELTGTVGRTAADALAAGRGSAADAVHVFIAAAHLMGVPARYVSGYLWRGGERDRIDATHAWPEAHVEGLGWVGFDPVEDRCPTDAYVRIATSLDQHGAAWVRGADHGYSEAHPTCRATITRVDV